MNKIPIELTPNIIKFIELDEVNKFYIINKKINKYLGKNDFPIWAELLNYYKIKLIENDEFCNMKFDSYVITFSNKIKIKNIFYSNKLYEKTT
tara:strand:- start:109 stop:387 length:279 start_codon:yes stop_codon:yes gene_type:complete